MCNKYTDGPQWNTYLKLMQNRPAAFLHSDRLPIVTEKEIVDRYVEETGKMVGVLYKSAYNMLVVDLVRNERQQLFTYERLVPTVELGAVAVIAVWNGRFVLLKQYRHALRGEQYAFPRGFGEAGISAEENVKKEISEELGAQAEKLTCLGTVFADSGLTGNPVKVYMCEVHGVQEKIGYEGITRVTLLTEEELEHWIADGKITDGFTLSAYSLYKCRSMHSRPLV